MSTDANKELVRRWFAETDRGNDAIVDELCAADYVDHSPPLPGMGSGNAGVQFALNVTRRTFLSYSASVAIVISLPSAAYTRPPLPRQTLRSYWHGPISGCLRHRASTFGSYSMAVWTVALPVPVTHT